jgi:hypothetical protein
VITAACAADDPPYDRCAISCCELEAPGPIPPAFRGSPESRAIVQAARDLDDTSRAMHEQLALACARLALLHGVGQGDIDAAYAEEAEHVSIYGTPDGVAAKLTCRLAIDALERANVGGVVTLEPECASPPVGVCCPGDGCVLACRVSALSSTTCTASPMAPADPLREQLAILASLRARADVLAPHVQELQHAGRMVSDIKPTCIVSLSDHATQGGWNIDDIATRTRWVIEAVR